MRIGPLFMLHTVQYRLRQWPQPALCSPERSRVPWSLNTSTSIENPSRPGETKTALHTILPTLYMISRRTRFLNLLALTNRERGRFDGGWSVVGFNTLVPDVADCKMAPPL